MMKKWTEEYLKEVDSKYPYIPRQYGTNFKGEYFITMFQRSLNHILDEDRFTTYIYIGKYSDNIIHKLEVELYINGIPFNNVYGKMVVMNKNFEDIERRLNAIIKQTKTKKKSLNRKGKSK